MLPALLRALVGPYCTEVRPLVRARQAHQQIPGKPGVWGTCDLRWHATPTRFRDLQGCRAHQQMPGERGGWGTCDLRCTRLGDLQLPSPSADTRRAGVTWCRGCCPLLTGRLLLSGGAAARLSPPVMLVRDSSHLPRFCAVALLSNCCQLAGFRAPPKGFNP